MSRLWIKTLASQSEEQGAPPGAVLLLIPPLVLLSFSLCASQRELLGHFIPLL